MTARLLHVGSAVVDHIYRLDALPTPGTEKTASDYTLQAGGGFNMMAAAARAGMGVAFGGQHGTGPNGDFLRAAFAAEGIEVLAQPSPSRDTGNCVVIVTADAERTFVSWPGAESVLSAGGLETVTPRPGEWVFTSGYTLSYPQSRDALTDWLVALPSDVPIVFDPTPVVADIPRDILAAVLARATWLSCNTAEAAYIAGAGNLATMASRLLADHCPDAAGVVIRAGDQGCLVRPADGDAREIPGFKVAAVDTNGAGDTHIGVFVSALARGEDTFAAARRANAAAAISVTRHGGATAPVQGEIDDFLARDKNRMTETADRDVGIRA